MENSKNCDDVLFYEANECESNYAGLATSTFIVPFSRAYENGQANRAFIQNQADSDNSSNMIFGPIEEEGALVGAVDVQINPLKSSFTSSSSGPKRGKMFTSELNVALIARSVSELDLILALVKSNDVGVIFKDANGAYRLLWHRDYTLDVDAEDQTGDSPTAEASATVKFSLTAPIPPIFFRGKIKYGRSSSAPTMILDCLTGDDSPIKPEE